MGNRKVFALLGLHVVFSMGIVGHQDIAVEGLDLPNHIVHNGHGLLGTQSAIHEILLHIHNDE